MKQEHYTRQALLNEEPYEREIIFNPITNHWYYDSYGSDAFRPEFIPTRRGPVRLKDLTEKKVVTQFLGINIEHFTSYDTLFMKDDNNHIAIFTMVETADDMGSVFRTDRKGFGYKRAHLYFDTYSEPNQGACHFLTTENLQGEWALLSLSVPRDRTPDQFEFTYRNALVKGCRTETEAKSYLNDILMWPDRLDDSRFKMYDTDDYLIRK